MDPITTQSTQLPEGLDPLLLKLGIGDIPPEILVFLYEMQKEIGIDIPDIEVRRQMIYELYERLNVYLQTLISEVLSDEKMEEYAQLLEKATTQEEVQSWLKAHVPDMENLMAQGLMQFRQTYLNPDNG